MSIGEGGGIGGVGRGWIGSRPSGIGPAMMGGSPGRVTVQVGMSAKLLNDLKQAAGGESIEDVIAKALAMFTTAAEAAKEGKHVGITDDAAKLETEFVGF